MPNRQAYRHHVDGIFTGYKWQCVELARRYLYLNHGYVFDDIAMAYDIFRLREVRRIGDEARLPLKSFRNGAKRHPEPGCMLIWNEGGEFEITGHVAIVTEVFPGGSFKVKTYQGHEVQAHLAGRLRRFRIRVVLGDRVTVGVSPYDLSKGRITYRHK